MAEKIFVEPEQVWDYFNQCREELDNSMMVIAENQDYGIEIYLVKSGILPEIMVTLDMEEIDSEICTDEDECKDIANYFYDEYLKDINASALSGDGLSVSDELMLIDERELEIDDAVHSLLCTLLGCEEAVYKNLDDLCEEIKDRLCVYLYKKHEISVYRPMYLEDEDGEGEFYEYPYPEMDLSEGDEDEY